MLYRNLDSLFAARPDSLLFGAGSPLARRTASRLHRKARHLASDLLTPERYELMRQFVAAQPLPAPGDEVQPDRTMLPWVDFLRAHGIEALYPVGTIAEVMADMGDRIGGVTQQTTNAIDWTGDLLSLRIRQDSLRDRLAMQLDSLERDFNRLTAVAEDPAGRLARSGRRLNARSPKPGRLSTPGVDNAFADIDRQRMALQHYVSAEREALVAQAQQGRRRRDRQNAGRTAGARRQGGVLDRPAGRGARRGSLPAGLLGGRLARTGTPPQGRSRETGVADTLPNPVSRSPRRQSEAFAPLRSNGNLRPSGLRSG